MERLRVPLGVVFLAGYTWHTFAPGASGTAVFLGAGTLLYAASVPRASAFHKVFALVAFAVFGVAVLSGRLEAAELFEEMPTYFGIIAVLLVLTAAGYPLRASRYEAQIRGLVAALLRRGAGIRATAGLTGHALGAVLDVGALVLVDVVSGRAAPARRLEALVWAARGFSFVPLWTNLNLLTATTIVLTGVSYPGLLAVSLPFVVLGLVGTVLSAQRSERTAGRDAEEATSVRPDEPLGRGAVAVVLYPVLLIAAVALVNQLFPGLSLTAAIAATVAVVVFLISAAAVVVLGRVSPMLRLGREAGGSLAASHAEFALFGSAGLFVISLGALGALAPLGDFLSALPVFLVAPALMVVMALGFLLGIHVIPMVLLLDAAFPLDGGPSPALWALALLLGSQATLLATPFSNAVTMLAKLSGKHPLEIGPRANWRFELAVAAAALAYLTLVSFLLL